MNRTPELEARRLLALDALQFTDQIREEWPVEKQLRHLREQIAMAQRHLEGDNSSEYTLITTVTPAMVDAAEEAYMPFGDMEAALNSAIAVAREAAQ